MFTLTWRELLQPAYVLAFGEAFLMGSLPVLGIASAVVDGGSMQIHAWPSGPSLLAAVLMGGLNGLRAIRTLAQPPPGPRGSAPEVRP